MKYTVNGPVRRIGPSIGPFTKGKIYNTYHLEGMGTMVNDDTGAAQIICGHGAPLQEHFWEEVCPSEGQCDPVTASPTAAIGLLQQKLNLIRSQRDELQRQVDDLHAGLRRHEANFLKMTRVVDVLLASGAIDKHMLKSAQDLVEQEKRNE